MRNYKSFLSGFIILSFLLAISTFTSCGGKKSEYSKVRSSSGMGNMKHKNKHVWGK